MRLGDVLANANDQIFECLDERDYGDLRPHIERLIAHMVLVRRLVELPPVEWLEDFPERELLPRLLESSGNRESCRGVPTEGKFLFSCTDWFAHITSPHAMHVYYNTALTAR
jgi:hypothetical protein